MQATQFQFDLSDEIIKAIQDMGYEQPTPIQASAIPALLEGRDVIGQAQTGTGKTAAFGIPLIQSLNPADRTVQALVLCPTRELAVQTAGELNKLARYRRGLCALPVFGGQPIERQLYALRAGAQVIVGTPGRVMDHMRRGTLDLSAIRVAVLDEADEMLDMGFRDDIETILRETPESRQTALFSATMPAPILQLAKRYLKNPMNISIARREMTVEKIVQSYFTVRAFHKTELLCRLLTINDIGLALVFCNTKRGVEDVVTQLQARGFAAAGLHGDMRQIERDAIMARFRQGSVSVLVATDVAARGLDIEGIEAVFNFDLPQDVEYYVHRIGRTGRAGKEGRAYSFAVGREVARMWEFRKATGARILCEQPPTGEALRRAQAERLVERIERRTAEEAPDDAALDELTGRLLEQMEGRVALEAALRMLLEDEAGRCNPALDIRMPEPPPRRAPDPQPVRRVQPAYAAHNGRSAAHGGRPAAHGRDGARGSRAAAPAPGARRQGSRRDARH